MSEQVYRPGRGPRHHNSVGFGVGQAASRLLKIYLNDYVLWLKIRCQTFEPRRFFCLWVQKGREDGWERAKGVNNWSMTPLLFSLLPV